MKDSSNTDAKRVWGEQVCNAKTTCEGRSAIDESSTSSFEKENLFQKLHPDLPIFGVTTSDRFAIYTPGKLGVVTSLQWSRLVDFWLREKLSGNFKIAQFANQFEEEARKVKATWSRKFTSPFTPECLIVYLSNQCNGQCIYCYAAAHRKEHPAVHREDIQVVPEAVLAASRLVAESCSRNGKPFRLVIHGGGEPTLHWELLQWIVSNTRKVAAEAKTDWCGHIATNGIISESHAAWIAEHFDSIGVSHDGPPSIHDQQRPMKNGRPSAATVERTIRILQHKDAHFYIRTTLMPRWTNRQSEIVEYLSCQLKVNAIRLEPVYRIRNKEHGGFGPDDAETFVRHFLMAQSRAKQLGVDMSLSGVRMNELHGPYCNVLRNTLHVVPEAVATACFFSTDRKSAARSSSIIGEWDRSANKFLIDEERIGSLRRRACHIPETCQDCLCAYNCTKGCPDICFTQYSGKGLPPLFRCIVTQLLATSWIRRAAENLCASPESNCLAIHDYSDGYE